MPDGFDIAIAEKLKSIAKDDDLSTDKDPQKLSETKEPSMVKFDKMESLGATTELLDKDGKLDLSDLMILIDESDVQDIIITLNTQLNELLKTDVYFTNSRMTKIIAKIAHKMLVIYGLKIDIKYLFFAMLFICYLLPSIALVKEKFFNKDKKEIPKESKEEINKSDKPKGRPQGSKNKKKSNKKVNGNRKDGKR